MKKCWQLLLVIALCVVLVGCGHTHTWQSATCVAPKICTACGETEGEALGHFWVDASCEESRFCTVCGLTSGDPLGHLWKDASCTVTMCCEVCSKTEGEANGHEMMVATCTSPQTCSVCGETKGDPLGHIVETWETGEEATCAKTGVELGTCTVCGEESSREIPLLEHIPGEWETVIQPTVDTEGTRVKNCTSCGTEIDREKYKLSEEELAKLYKSNCKSISYDKLSRTPGEYKGEYVKFTGYVVQVCSEAESALYYSTYRVATKGKYNNVVYIKVDNYGSGSRILEDDRITFYGEFSGLFTYETVMGASVTIPCITVAYID